ncbi:MAG: tandem-95 repeat protein [Gammaproteobacteria bacterium]|nr:tandem-95 repeat protein [Gammaproteobacteria bacterium]
MNDRSLHHYARWVKTIVLLLASLVLVFLPDWGVELRAQSSVATLSPTAVNFGSVPVGTTSSPRTVTLTNNDPQFAILVTSVTTTGSFSASGCSATLPPSSSCNVSLTFLPGTTGVQTGLLTVIVDTCSDGCIERLTATLTGNGVTPIAALDDTATTAAGTSTSVNVLTNDTGTGLVITAVGTPAHGSAVLSGSAITYTPNINFSGSDTFTYRITDRFGQTDAATVTVTVNPPGLNAVNDAATTAAGTPTTISVLSNDTGTGLTVSAVGTPAHGSAVLSGSAVTYTPAAGFAGTDTFTYTITDRFSQTDTATVTVTVNSPGLNAVNDAATTTAGTPTTISVLSNDTGTGLTLSAVSTPAHGSAVLSGSTVSYTPAAGFAGTDTFTYTITDSFSQTDTATVTVTVSPPGLNAVNDAATTAAGTPTTINVLSNDTGVGLTLSAVSTPAHGSAVLSGSTVTYTPVSGFAGTDTFTYTITDSFSQTDTATVTVTVNPPSLNAVNDAATTAAGTPITVSVLSNDTGTGLTVSAVSTPANGSAVISGSAVSYTPAVGFAGTDTFTYTITDSFSQTDTATVTITVSPPALNAVNDAAATQASTPVTVSVLANDTGMGLTVSAVSTPANGSAVLSGSAITYTSVSGFAGTDSFTYTITDSFSQTDTATVTVTVNSATINAVNDAATTAAGASTTVSVLANDTGTGLTVSAVSTPANGSAVISGSAISYTPNTNFAGTDTFTYTITDSFSQTDTATVTVTVNSPGLKAVNDTATTQASMPVTVSVLSNDTGVGLAITAVGTPAHGSAVLSGSTVSYTPAAGFTGTDTFTYTITDSFSQTDTATVTVTVSPSGLNAVDDAATTAAGTPITVSVLSNDTGTGLTVSAVSAPVHGSAVLSGSTVTYTPTAGFTGTDAFTYTITDSFSRTDTATVTVIINPSGLNAVDDATTTTSVGTSITVNVLANDAGSGLTLTSVSPPAHGSAVISGNTVIYTPASGFAGTDSFIYTITDSFGQTDTATVTVTINPSGLNAVNDAVTTPAGTPITINVLSNDAGTGLTLITVGPPAHGNAVISDGAVIYTPASGFSGADTFTYTITDSFGQTATAAVTVTVNPSGLNAVNDTATTPAGTPVTVSVLANDTGEGLSLVQVGSPSNGRVVVSGNAVTYTPDANFAGFDIFTYTIRDRFEQTAAATVRITVNRPTLSAVDDAVTTPVSTPIAISVLANDTGTGLTLARVSTPLHGSVTISNDVVTYLPNADFIGTDTFTYRITDSFDQTATATVTVIVSAPGLNAVNDAATTSAGTPITIDVLTNDTGEGLTLVQIGSPLNGNAVISGNAVVYTPAANFAGADGFSYTVRDSFNKISTARVTVTVTPSALIAVDDTAITPARISVTIPVLANDVGTGLVIVQASTPVHGSTSISGSAIVYTPALNFAGSDSFIYSIRDSFSQSESATVQVTVMALALEAVDDAAATSFRTPIAIPVLTNDVGTDLTIIQVGSPAHGSAVIGADGVIDYTPASSFVGTDTFTYTISDGISTDSAVVSITITRDKEDVQALLEDTTDDPSAKTVGRAIGGLCFDRSASANFLRDCDSLVNAASNQEPGVGSALEQITPRSLTTAVDAAQTSVQSQMLGIRSRMAALRSGVMGINLDNLNIQRGGWTLSGRDLRYLLASVGEEIGGVPSAADVGADLGAFGVFASGAINLGNKDQTENQAGFDFKTLEVTLGADYRFSDQSILGAAISYTATDTDIDGNGGYLDSHGYGLTLYGVYYPSERLYVEGMVNYGHNDYDQRRNVAYKLQNVDVKQGFDSSYSGRQFFADVGAGYQFRRGNLTFGPEARLSYFDLKVDPFEERASNRDPGSAWAVAMSGQNLQSLVFSLGGKASYLLDRSWGTLEPQVEISWLHEFKDNNRLVNGRFVEGAAVPDNIFQIFTDPVDKNYFRFGLGLQARLNQGPSVLIQYRTLFDYEQLETHTISTQLRWDF